MFNALIKERKRKIVSRVKNESVQFEPFFVRLVESNVVIEMAFEQQVHLVIRVKKKLTHGTLVGTTLVVRTAPHKQNLVERREGMHDVSASRSWAARAGRGVTLELDVGLGYN